MPREIRTQTRNPALVAACLDILDHYASGAEPKTPFQRAVYAALARSDPYRRISARQMAHFDAIPTRITAP